MDILTIVLACSLHFDDQLVTALIHRVSNDNPLLVGDFDTLETHGRLTSVPEANAAVADILKRGGRPAVGLMAIPVTWAAKYGRTTDDLFDACTNVSVGTAVLSEYDRLCRPQSRPSAATARHQRHATKYDLERSRTCILRHLGSDLGVSGYAEGVMKDIASRRLRPPDPIVDPPPAQSPIVPLDDGPPNAPPPTLAHASSPPVSAPIATPSTSKPTAPLLPPPDHPPPDHRTVNSPAPPPHSTAPGATANVSVGAASVVTSGVSR